ncbi:MAG: SPOR domain-containing protein [Treponema sp.]|nr:SPOR domain-containing protein [Treponema sp.]
MEQKRVLWIVIAAGIFLLVVLCPAIILYKPATNQKQNIVSLTQKEQSPWSTPIGQGGAQSGAQDTYSAQGRENFSSGNASSSFDSNARYGDTSFAENKTPSNKQGEVTAQDPAYINDMTVFAQNATVFAPVKTPSDGTVIDLGAINRFSSVTPQNEVTASKMESVKNTTYSEHKNVEAASTSPKAVATKPAKSNVSSASSGKKASGTVKASSKASTTNATPQYWVQAASYANKKGADTARTMLDTNKIPADVFTYKDKQGKVFYRVRVGPYTTKSEAEYWRTRIAQIDDFKKTQSFVTQTVN